MTLLSKGPTKKIVFDYKYMMAMERINVAQQFKLILRFSLKARNILDFPMLHVISNALYKEKVQKLDVYD